MAKNKAAPTLLEAAKAVISLIDHLKKLGEDDALKGYPSIGQLRAAIKAHERAPTVYVHVNGGAVTIGKGVGVEVEVVDFDTDGVDSNRLCDGHNCEVREDHTHEVYKADESEVI